MYDWIINNKEWFFSGLGVFLLGLIVVLFKIFTNKGGDSGGKIQSIGNRIKSKGNVTIKDIKQEMH